VAAVSVDDPYRGAAEGWAAGASLVYRPLVEALVAAAPHRLHGRTVLDVGAGTGLGSAALRQAGAQPVAVDFSFDMLAWNRRRRPPAAAADVRALPVATDVVDDVLAAFVLNHVDDPHRGLAELGRVVRPGGAVLANVFSNRSRSEARDEIDRLASQWGMVVPDWYTRVKEVAAPLLGSAEAMGATAEQVGLVALDVSERAVPVGVETAESLVAYRLGQANYVEFLASLGDDAEAFRRAAVAAVRPLMQPYRPIVVTLAARVPSGRFRAGRSRGRMHRMARSLIAVNTAPDSENRMHGDEASRYGFAGGLVPGVDVLGYLAHEAVAQWGADWLASGRLAGRLDAPVYDGEAIEVTTEHTPTGLEAWVLGPDASVRARAALSLLAPADDPAVLAAADPGDFAVAVPPAPEERPPATAERLAPGTVLATQRARFRAARAPSYLDELSETHPAFRELGLAHPGWLLRFANWALASTVRLGPWIHTASDARFLAAVHDGDELEVRGRVADRYERKGHQFVDLQVLALVDGTPAVYVDHRAIWRPRPVTDPDRSSGL
jgi:SAM-dependent methyltransferase